ncbi:hypothetical protein BGZ83_000937 [Gryganskiella cystojenkinii]|nr:hypothetical protein BGZ83_000937 [Gryganskiella cystojenkinii]
MSLPLTPVLLKASEMKGLTSSLALAGTNLISLALFEDHLSSAFQVSSNIQHNSNNSGSRIFRNLCLIVMGLVMAVRVLMGFVFSRAVGWQIPSLFFSDSMFECNLGLAPYLFALLIVQSIFPSPSTSTSSTEKPVSSWRMKRIHVQILLCLLNAIPKTIVWWAGAGMVVGFFASLLISYQQSQGYWGGRPQTVSAFEKLSQHNHLWDDEAFEAMLEDEDAFSDSTLPGDEFSFKGHGRDYNKKHGGERSTWKKFAFMMPTLLFVLLILISGNQMHTYKPDVGNVVLSSAVEPETPFLLTLILMTAPRKHGMTYIKETLSSYLANFPEEEVDPLYSRIQIVVYTHFTDFPGYDEAKAYFDKIPKARKHVQWVREDGFEKNHRHHLVSAIRKVGTLEDSVYLGLMEDDFPFCEGGWQTMLNTLYEANQRVSDHCGLFVGTGGSGLIFKRSVALTASFILESDALAHSQGITAPPPDISLQDCLMGKHEFCSSCAGTLVTSRTLLQRHLGYNSSTSGDGYDKNQFQCGWRQPFNGLPTVHTL